MTTKQTTEQPTVKFRDLIASDTNPRTSMTAEGIEGLAASILEDGVLQNLIVRKKGRKYEITTGGRRFAALSLLHERGKIPADYPVPVTVRSDLGEQDALRVATVENIQREQLSPLDEAEAFARMARDGDDLATIAAKAGVSEMTVRRRLAIAGLCDEAKAALRADDITLAIAEALTLGNHAQQQDALKQLGRGWYDADDVRGWFTEEKPCVAQAIFPREQYQGTYTSDLFAEEESTYFDDVPQFIALQSEAAKARAETLRAAGQAVDLIEAEYVDWWQYVHADDETSLTIIHLKPDGLVDIREGLVKRQTHASVSGATAATAEKAKGAKPEYSKSLLRYMAVRKTLAVQSALLKNERVAKQVAIVQLMTTSSFKSRIRGEVHTAHQGEAANADNAPALAAEVLGGFLDLTPRERFNRYVPAIDAIMRENRRPVALYGKLKDMGNTTLDELFRLLTIICFGQLDIETVDRSDSLFNHVAQDLAVDMAQCWRPDEAFLSGRTTDQLVQLARDSGATEVIGDTKGWKKKELVTALVRYFQRTDRTGAIGWLPDAMRFNITEEPEEAEDDAELDDEDDEAFDADADEGNGDDMADAA